MTAALEHRGPDDEGYYSDDDIFIGFRRLSIVDLDGGHQPISNETGDVILVCNGEIYNSPELRKQLSRAGHRFRTQSDVEAILHLYEEYGLNCFGMLEGMFAVALWDKQRKRLVLARDHMGQKPLFYALRGNEFYFASEVQSLLASGRFTPELSEEALWHYLSLRSVPENYSLVKGVHKLPAASYLVFENGRTSMERYWHLDFRNKSTLSHRDSIDALDELLCSTVKSHLLSDVTVGTFISGGIDSTTVASMMAAQSENRIPAFSIGVREASFDELPIARQVAEANGLEFHGQRVHADIAELMPKMVHHLGEPADAYGVGVYLVSKLASQHVKAVLCGDGGDESFGGYDRYRGQKLVDLVAILPGALRRSVIAGLIRAVPESFQYKSMAQKLRWLQYMCEYEDGERYARALGFLRFPPEAKQQLFTGRALERLTGLDSVDQVLRFFNAENVSELIDRMLYTDLMTRVSDHNLVMTDRMSMAWSLEVRSPFVDPRVVEFAARLPADLKVRGRKLKYALRQVASRYIPSEVVRLPKQGFGFPVGQWMRQDLRTAVESRLFNSRFVEQGLFRKKYVEKLVGEHMAGVQDHSYRLWLLLGLEIWHELYIEGRPLESVSL
jgi:asparagine synthase (glutamine-hydrolysing)